MLFLSHSSQDNEQAQRLKEALGKRGFEAIFLDLDPEAGIQAGESWQAVLYRRLRSCQALVAVVSDDFLASKWCFAEVALARMQGKKLFGVMTEGLKEDAVLPALLSDRQLVDGRTDFDEAVDRLVGGLERLGLAPKAVRAWDRSRSPYPGFSAFMKADWGVFFGRDEEIEAGVAMVRGAVRGTASRMALILGASGSGKSSLLRAGIVHRLQHEEHVVIVGPFRPGLDPLDELEASVADAFELAKAPREEASLGKWLRGLLREKGLRGHHVVIAIDQFEELLGRPEGHDADRFLALMADELAEVESQISFIGTLRSDQLAALQSHRAGRELEWQSLFLGPLDAGNLRQIIEEPARLAELGLEPGLTDRLIQDTRGVQALPLLALTLRRLWEKGGEDGLLEIHEYEALGGIQGAVARIANDALAGVRDDAALDGLKEALLRMVRLDDQRNAVRQPVQWDATREEARPLLDRLIKSRLLVREQGELQVAHEALFTAWDRLSEWINESREALIVHQQVAEATRLWAPDRLDTDLWRGARLDRALELSETGLLALDPMEQEFLAASVHARELALEEKQREEALRERLSRVALGRGLAYQALGEAEDRPQRGLLLAVEAANATRDAGLPVTAAAEKALQDLLYQSGGESLLQLDSTIQQISFEKGRMRFAAGCENGTIAVVSMDQPTVVENRWQGHESEVEALSISGQIVISRHKDGAVFLWELHDAGRVDGAQMADANEAGTHSAFNEARSLLVIATGGGVPVLYELAAGTNRPLDGADGVTTALAFSPDGEWLVDGRDTGQLILWNLTSLPDLAAPILIDQHKAPIRRIEWAASAPVFVTTDKDNELICRWTPGDEPGNINLVPLQSSGSSILDLAVSPDGNLVAVATWHSEGFCWVAADNFYQYILLKGHSSSFSSIDVSPDGYWLATSSSRDNYVLLWPTHTLQEGPQSIPVRGEDRWIEQVRFAPDGSIVAGSWAGAVRRWLKTNDSPDQVNIPGVDLNQYACSWDRGILLSAGARVAIGGEVDPQGKLVYFRTGTVQAIDDPPRANAVAMTPDGQWMAVAGEHQIWIKHQATGRELRVEMDMDGWFGTLALDPGGRWLVAGDSESFYVFDLVANGERSTIDQHQGGPVSCVFDEQGRWLLTADTEGLVILWECRDEGLTRSASWNHPEVKWCGFVSGGERWVSGNALGIQTGLAGSPDRAAVHIETGWQDAFVRVALTRNAGRMVLCTQIDGASWDLSADDPAGSRVDLPRHEGYINALAISADGRRAATSMVNGPIRLWNLDAPSTPVSLPRQQSSAMMLEFVNKDQVLISGQSGGTLAFWDLNVDTLLYRARRVAGRDLTDEERRRFLEVG